MSEEDEFIAKMLGLFERAAELTTLARMAEVLKIAQRDVGNLLESIKQIAEVDAAVAPELLTALTSLGEVSAAINRATQFVFTRYEVSQETFRQEEDNDA